MVSWAVSGLAVALGLAAVVMVRRLARRVDGVIQSYWELRYEYTRIRSRLARLDPEDPAPPEPPPPSPSVTFVPLSTIRKKEQ